MVAKICAVWFVLLSVLPFTAPFSSIDAADFAARGGAHGEIGLLTTQPSDAVADNSVMVSDRSGFFSKSRLCAIVTIASCDVVAAFHQFLLPAASTTFTATPPPLATALRI